MTELPDPAAVTHEYLDAYPTGTVIAWQDQFYFGLARRNDASDPFWAWDFVDRAISTGDLVRRIRGARRWYVLAPIAQSKEIDA